MSTDPHAFDPYRSPSLPEGPYAGGQVAAGRPGLLTALCVLCIVLGTLGLMNSLFGTIGALAGPKLQQMIQPKSSPSMPQEMQKVQQEFQDEVIRIQGKYYWESVVALLFRFAAALLLLIGGLRTLGFAEPGRKVLLVACAVALAFELAHAILQSMVQMEMMSSVNSLVEGLLNNMPQNKDMPAGFKGTMSSIVRGSIIAQLVIMYLLVLAKAGLYLFGLIYLQKPHIKALFKSVSSSTFQVSS